MMNKIKKLFVSFLVITFVSVGLTGCTKEEPKKPGNDQPIKEKPEHPTEHPN
ncbi:MAG: hypothetical protein K9M57_03025 [Phycisphaerae bacterium]|nr:hypothetical protein [Phycisphaerae bacterium]